MTYFSQRLRTARHARGLSQRQLAATTRIKADNISAYECGHYAPSLLTLRKLCDALDVSADWLLGREG